MFAMQAAILQQLDAFFENMNASVSHRSVVLRVFKADEETKYVMCQIHPTKKTALSFRPLAVSIH